ncbi:MFS transporter [Alicyclobacillus shizuokensis]|uniref:MFS transporter n=1 Tax=Alicyclobacillus shizuokensis TaxID=392014 RepID=UPI001FDFA80A|nr:MFS transporter [Alicyclobacillus shizuokensis]
MAVWAVAFACVIAFMGLGLVDPILKAIASQLHATPSQTELLFSSYMLVTGVAMLVTNFVSHLIGPKWTLLAGLFLIVAFAALAGSSQTIWQIVGFRAGWGLGNALFIATALAVIVSVASGGTAGAIILYEAALGLGISVGPLLGGVLGSISWRGPFYGVALLMAIGFILILVWLRGVPKPAHDNLLHSLAAPAMALRHRGLLIMGIMALLYNFGFFTLLGFSPFVLTLNIYGLGYVFFGWGVLLAITSVFVAPRLQARFGTVPVLIAILLLIGLDLLTIGLFTTSQTVVIVAIIVAGAFLGVNNTVVTTAVMEVSPFERPVASAAYSFVRFVGGAVAPWLAGKLAEWYNPHVSFYVGAAALGLAILVVFSGRRFLLKQV